MLRASDIPLAAVDGHVTQGVVSALLADDTILTGLEELGCQEEYAGDDPQQILSQLMYVYATRATVSGFLVLFLHCAFCLRVFNSLVQQGIVGAQFILSEP